MTNTNNNTDNKLDEFTISNDQIISNLKNRIAYTNSSNDYRKGEIMKKKCLILSLTLALICSITFGADAATGGNIKNYIRAVIIGSDGTESELPIDFKTDDKGNKVATFKHNYNTSNGESGEVKGKFYYNNDNDEAEVKINEKDNSVEVVFSNTSNGSMIGEDGSVTSFEGSENGGTITRITGDVKEFQK